MQFAVKASASDPGGGAGTGTGETGLSTGAKAGIAVAVVIGVIAAGAILYWSLWKAKQKRAIQSNMPPPGVDNTQVPPVPDQFTNGYGDNSYGNNSYGSNSYGSMTDDLYAGRGSPVMGHSGNREYH
jgi:hypothetical protein